MKENNIAIKRQLSLYNSCLACDYLNYSLKRTEKECLNIIKEKCLCVSPKNCCCRKVYENRHKKPFTIIEINQKEPFDRTVFTSTLNNGVKKYFVYIMPNVLWFYRKTEKRRR